MARKPKPVPSYRLHKQSGQAVVTLRDATGKRRDMLLGKFDTPESRAEYRRVLIEHETCGGHAEYRRAEDARKTSLSVAELCVLFMKHAMEHYRHADGTLTNEISEYKMTIRVLSHLYAHTLASDFGPLAMKSARLAMIKGYLHPLHGEQPALCRGVANNRSSRIRQIFKWALGEQLVKPEVFVGLGAVRGLQRGRSDARETEPISPVAPAIVEETLPFLSRTVGAMVRVLMLTGMRSGEVCSMRWEEIDRTGPLWIYTPRHHKTTHRDKSRAVPLGPRVLAVLREFQGLSLTGYVFSPAAAEAERRAEATARRKTLPSCDNRPGTNRKRNPKRTPGPFYTSMSFGAAVTKGIRKANKARTCQACRKLKAIERCQQCQATALPHWHPHQLRHSHATEVRRRYGLEAAAAALGHAHMSVTELHAEKNAQLAVRIAGEIG